MKTIALMLIPQDYKDNIFNIQRILVTSLNHKIIMDSDFNSTSYLQLKKLIDEAEKVITYNGYTQYCILEQFNLISSDSKIIHLLDEFSWIFDPNFEPTEYNSSPKWQKLKTATKYYGYYKQREYDDSDPIHNIKASQLTKSVL